ncbi:uncharacterized protein LOC131940444 isoform X2 [Physella acuta]|uniref:uncharacterized protein LOC131940444 isoform X2 n=1 Tax=Physella acuta TaxID=109671 RepID=UPI0027DE7A51|nr:uncharacterized protein LOC131940444 isoform X2 [Physella acuta]
MLTLALICLLCFFKAVVCCSRPLCRDGKVILPLEPLTPTCTVTAGENDVLTCSWAVPEFSKSDLVTSELRRKPAVPLCGDEEEQILPCEAIDQCTLQLTYDSIFLMDCWYNISVRMRFNTSRKFTPAQEATVTSSWFIIDPYSIMQLTPPVDLRLLGANTSCVTLNWAVEFESFEPEVNEVSYTSSWESIETTQTFKEDLRDVTLCELTSYTRYYISVRRRGHTSSVWSEAGFLTATTAEDIPLCYTQEGTDAYNILVTKQPPEGIIYWQSPPPQIWQSATALGYVVYSRGHSPDPWRQVGSVASHVTQAHVPVSLTGVTQVRVVPRNVHGEARCEWSSYMLAVLEKEILPFNVTATWDHGSVTVSWSLAGGVDVWPVVLWCKQSNGMDVCQNEINWARLDTQNLTYQVNNLTLAEAQLHQFGVSVKLSKSNISSQVIWTSCLQTYIENKLVLYGRCPPPENRTKTVVSFMLSLLSLLALVPVIGLGIHKLYRLCVEAKNKFTPERMNYTSAVISIPANDEEEDEESSKGDDDSDDETTSEYVYDGELVNLNEDSSGYRSGEVQESESDTGQFIFVAPNASVVRYALCNSNTSSANASVATNTSDYALCNRNTSSANASVATNTSVIDLCDTNSSSVNASVATKTSVIALCDINTSANALYNRNTSSDNALDATNTSVNALCKRNTSSVNALVASNSSGDLNDSDASNNSSARNTSDASNDSNDCGANLDNYLVTDLEFNPQEIHNHDVTDDVTSRKQFIY